MNFWITSDTHYGHESVIEYCDRPLDYEEKLFTNLATIIKPNDVLIHLGDICFGEQRKNHEKYIASLNCKKWLIKGNHDKNSYSWYLEYWDFVAESINLKYYGKDIILSHIPILNHDSDINIHGHMHNKGHRGNIDEFGFLISVEHLNYKPIKLERCIKLINRGEKYAT